MEDQDLMVGYNDYRHEYDGYDDGPQLQDGDND